VAESGQPKTPSQTPPSLLDQYDLGDTDRSSTLGAGEPAPRPASPPKDPATGRFVSQSKHPDRLTRIAKDLGFGQDEIDSLPTAELRQEIQIAQQERANQRQIDSISRAMEQPSHPARGDAAGEPVSSPAAPEYDLGIDETQYDSGIIGAMKKLADQNKKLQARLDQVENYTRAQQHETAVQRLDRAFGSLGATFEGLLGKGSRADLDPKSVEVRRRKAIVEEAMALAGPKASVEAVASKIEEAARTFFGVPQKAKKEKEPQEAEKPTPEQEEWLDGALERPTHRLGSDEPLGREKAIRAIEQARRRNGTAQTTLDEFPG
jgi:hypothetical protein